MRKKQVVVWIIVGFMIFLLLILSFSLGITGNVLKSIFTPTEITKQAVRIVQDEKLSLEQTQDQEIIKDPDKEGDEKYATFLRSNSPPSVTDFYGEINFFDESYPAPIGTTIYAIADVGDARFDCGSFTVTNQNPGIGWYGLLHCSCGGENPDCSGEEIVFEAALPGGQREHLTKYGNSIWDESFKRVDLKFERYCGDANNDGAINILDIVYLINYKYKNGPAPFPLFLGDVNGDPAGNVNILDIVYLITYKFKGGPAPIPTNGCNSIESAAYSPPPEIPEGMPSNLEELNKYLEEAQK